MKSHSEVISSEVLSGYVFWGLLNFNIMSTSIPVQQVVLENFVRNLSTKLMIPKELGGLILLFSEFKLKFDSAQEQKHDDVQFLDEG